MEEHGCHKEKQISLFLLDIFFIYISNFKCYPESSPNTPLLPDPPTPTSWPWHSPVLRHIKFAQPMGLSFHWWPTRPSSDSYAARDMSSGGGGVLVSSYCCSTYTVAEPFSSLSTFSSSSIGCPVIHTIANCEHPLLYLPGPSIASQGTAISGSFQQNLGSVCNGVSVWKLIMGWIPGFWFSPFPFCCMYSSSFVGFKIICSTIILSQEMCYPFF